MRFIAVLAVLASSILCACTSPMLMSERIGVANPTLTKRVQGVYCLPKTIVSIKLTKDAPDAVEGAPPAAATSPSKAGKRVAGNKVAAAKKTAPTPPKTTSISASLEARTVADGDRYYAIGYQDGAFSNDTWSVKNAQQTAGTQGCMLETVSSTADDQTAAALTSLVGTLARTASMLQGLETANPTEVATLYFSPDNDAEVKKITAILQTKYSIALECVAGCTINQERLDKAAGVVTRLALPAIWQACSQSCDDPSKVLSRLEFLSFNASPSLVTPFERTALVKQTMTATFADGSLKETKGERPSPIAAGFALPGALIGSIVDGFVQPFKDQTSIVNARKGLIDAETERLKSLAALEKQRAENAKKPDPPPED